MRHTSLILALVLCMGLLVSGCAAPGLTKQQVHMRHREAIQQNLLQMQEDIDTLFLIDRPSRMSPMMVR